MYDIRGYEDNYVVAQPSSDSVVELQQLRMVVVVVAVVGDFGDFVVDEVMAKFVLANWCYELN